MDLAIILVTFALGFAAARVGLPPLVGYLGAGFALHAFGYQTNGAGTTCMDSAGAPAWVPGSSWIQAISNQSSVVLSGLRSSGFRIFT